MPCLWCFPGEVRHFILGGTDAGLLFLLPMYITLVAAAASASTTTSGCPPAPRSSSLVTSIAPAGAAIFLLAMRPGSPVASRSPSLHTLLVLPGLASTDLFSLRAQPLVIRALPPGVLAAPSLPRLRVEPSQLLLLAAPEPRIWRGAAGGDRPCRTPLRFLLPRLRFPRLPAAVLREQ